MIINLFSYSSNFGKVSISKCDFFGNQLSTTRSALVNSITAEINMPDNDELLFGGFNQPNFYKLENREVKVSAEFLFSIDLSGTLDPAIDLLINCSAYSYQGTNISYKSSINTISTTSLTYNDLLPYRELELNASGVFKFYLVNQSSVLQIIPINVNTTVGLITFQEIDQIPADCWLEVFKYGNVSTSETFPIYYEPMIRMDTSEGSFYPCLINKISFNIDANYIKMNCDFIGTAFDATNRYEFVNATQQKISTMPIIPMHKSRIIISNYTNDVTSTFDITDLNLLTSMAALITQNPAITPVTELSFSIDNSIQVLYGNVQEKMYRRFIRALYSKQRTVSGTMKVLALRSAQPTFNHYPVLNNKSNSSLQLFFSNQVLTIPYTIWEPLKLSQEQNNFVSLSYSWRAITRDREGQPIFEMENANN